MSAANKKTDYMLLFRGTDWTNDLSPEQLQRVLSDWANWFERLIQEGQCTGGHPLHPEGKVVAGKDGGLVTDGPFAESKEAIGGYFYLRVADLEEALQIAKQCPGLEYGCVVEVRPVAEQCTVSARAVEQAIRRQEAAGVMA